MNNTDFATNAVTQILTIANPTPAIPAQTIAKLVKNIPEQQWIKLLLGPLYDLNTCYQSIIKHKRVEARYLILGSIVLVAIIVGIIVPLTIPAYAQWLQSVFTPTQNNDFLASVLTAWFFATVASGGTRLTIFLTLIAIYGDENYFLTKQRQLFLITTLQLNREDLNSFYFYLRDFCPRDKIVDAKSRTISNVLETFMYDSVPHIKTDFNLLWPGYLVWLLQVNGIESLDETKLTWLASIYKVSSTQAIKDTIAYCLYCIKQNYDTVGARPQDYEDIIAQILSGDVTGAIKFMNMQSLQIKQSMELKKHQDQNAQAMLQLSSIQAGNVSPRASIPRLIEQMGPALSGTSTAVLHTPRKKIRSLMHAESPDAKISVTEEEPLDIEKGRTYQGSEEQKYTPTATPPSERAGDEIALADLGKMAVCLSRLQSANKQATTLNSHTTDQVFSVEPSGEPKLAEWANKVIHNFLEQQSTKAAEQIKRIPPAAPPTVIQEFTDTSVVPVGLEALNASVENARVRASSLRANREGLRFASSSNPEHVTYAGIPPLRQEERSELEKPQVKPEI